MCQLATLCGGGGSLLARCDPRLYVAQEEDVYHHLVRYIEHQFPSSALREVSAFDYGNPASLLLQGHSAENYAYICGEVARLMGVSAPTRKAAIAAACQLTHARAMHAYRANDSLLASLDAAALK